MCLICPSISFKYNKSLLYVLIYWILELPIEIINDIIPEYSQIVKNIAINEYIKILLKNIICLFSGFFVLYIYKKFLKTPKLSKNEIEEKKLFSKIFDINYIRPQEWNLPKSKFFIFKIIVVICLKLLVDIAIVIFFLANTDATYNNFDSRVQKEITNNLDILIRYIISSYILKLNLGKHHKCAMIFVVITICLLFPSDILETHFYSGQMDERLTWTCVGFLLIVSIIYPIEDFFIKSIYEKDYILPEILMFIRAIGVCLLLLIISLILYFTMDITDDLEFNPNKIDLAYFIPIFIFYILSSFIKSYILVKIIYIYSAQSISFFIITQSINESIINIIKTLNDIDDIWQGMLAFVQFIAILITIFVILLYAEIIVIREWALDYDVKDSIDERSADDNSRMYSISESEFGGDFEEVEDDKGDKVEMIISKTKKIQIKFD